MTTCPHTITTRTWACIRPRHSWDAADEPRAAIRDARGGAS